MVNFHFPGESDPVDPAFAKELAGDFLNQINGLADRMMDHYRSGRNLQLAYEVHTVRSSVLLFGLEVMARQLQRLQRLAETDPQSRELAALLEETAKGLQPVEEALRSWIGEP